jgi:hypothetical protein
MQQILDKDSGLEAWKSTASDSMDALLNKATDTASLGSSWRHNHHRHRQCLFHLSNPHYHRLHQRRGSIPST